MRLVVVTFILLVPFRSIVADGFEVVGVGVGVARMQEPAVQVNPEQQFPLG